MMKKENKNDRKEKILRWVNQADLDQIVKEREGLIIKNREEINQAQIA